MFQDSAPKGGVRSGVSGPAFSRSVRHVLRGWGMRLTEDVFPDVFRAEVVGEVDLRFANRVLVERAILKSLLRRPPGVLCLGQAVASVRCPIGSAAGRTLISMS